MKLYFKRKNSWVDNTARIHVESEELTFIIMALKQYKEWMYKNEWHLENKEDWAYKQFEKAVQSLEELSMKNALDIDTNEKMFTNYETIVFSANTKK